MRELRWIGKRVPIDRYFAWEYKLQMVKVVFTAPAFKSLSKLPGYIVSKLKVWIRQVELLGLQEVRRLSGYHDEPLKGVRAGQRSVRLNQAYRAIYEEAKDGKSIVVTIVEVNKHEY